MKTKKNKPYLLFAGIGFELVGLVVLAFFLGRWIGEMTGLGGLPIGLCILLSFIIWFVHLLFLIRKVS